MFVCIGVWLLSLTTSNDYILQFVATIVCDYLSYCSYILAILLGSMAVVTLTLYLGGYMYDRKTREEMRAEVQEALKEGVRVELRKVPGSYLRIILNLLKNYSDQNPYDEDAVLNYQLVEEVLREKE